MPPTASSSAPQTREDSSPALSAAQKRDLVQRVVNSQTFMRSPALCAFLVYITDHQILGHTDKLKEQTIGAEVLGRKPNYDPADDNIVRVRAHELRGRLERYFSSEGKDEQVVITIPRGAYAPEFTQRQSVTAPEAQRQAQPSEATPVPDAAETGNQKLPLRLWLMFAVALLIAAAGSAAITRYIVKEDSHGAAAQPAANLRDFWGQFFPQPNEELKVVYSDTSFALWQDLNGKTLELGDYLNRNYYSSQGNKLFDVVMRRVTTPADMALSVHLATLASEFGGEEVPEFARDADSQFFHHGNFVLIGSHRSDPWVAIYEPSLNFQLDQDSQTGAPLFRNRSPQGHEAAVFGIPDMFDTQKTVEKTYSSYGVVALLKGCGDHGLTVLAEGLNAQATQAAGDLITDPQRMDALLRSIGHQPGTRVVPFEALFQITSMPGGYDNPRVIAYRLRSPEQCVGG